MSTSLTGPSRRVRQTRGALMSVDAGETMHAVVQQSLASNEHVVRSLMTHIAFALAFALASPSPSSDQRGARPGSATRCLPVAHLVALTKAAVHAACPTPVSHLNALAPSPYPSRNSFPNHNSDSENRVLNADPSTSATQPSQLQSHPDSPRVLPIIALTSAHAILASIPPHSQRIRQLKRNLSRSKIVPIIKAGCNVHYPLRFKGGGETSQWSAFNGQRVFLEYGGGDMVDVVLIEDLQLYLDAVGYNGSTSTASAALATPITVSNPVKTTIATAPIESTSIESDIPALRHPLDLHERALNFLQLKTQLVNLTLSLLSLPTNFSSTTLPHTIPLLPLAKRVRRAFYDTHVLPHCIPHTPVELPLFNLGTDATDPEYDLHEDSVTPAALTRDHVAQPKRRWPRVWADWAAVRGITARSVFRRLLFDQWIPLVPSVGSDRDGGGGAGVRVDVVEENGVREYPWVVVLSRVDTAGALEGLEADVGRLVERCAAMMDREVVLPNGDAAGEDLVDFLKGLNVNLLLLECKDRLEEGRDPLGAEVARFLLKFREEANKRRAGYRDAFAAMRIDVGDEDDEEEADDIVGVKMGAHQAAMDEALFDGFVDPLKALLRTVRPPPNIQAHRLAFLNNLQRIITSAFGSGYTARLFGSSVTCLASTNSDADVTILLDNRPHENPSGHPIANMYLLAAVLRHNGMKEVFPVATAKVPIVKFFDPAHGLKADVNVGNALGIQNSAMIVEYMRLDGRVRDLILLVKHWAKMRELNDSAEGGTFSSYALTLMLLSYLQIQGVIPSLQELFPSSRERTFVIARVNAPMLKSTKSKADAKATAAKAFAEYKERLQKGRAQAAAAGPVPLLNEPPSMESLTLRDPPDYVVHGKPAQLNAGMVAWDVSYVSAQDPLLAARGFLKPYLAESQRTSRAYHQSLALFLHGFFEHYGHVHKFTNAQIVSVRRGSVIGRRDTHVGLHVRKAAGERPGELHVVVEDPFQLDRNTAGMVKHVTPVVAEFRRAAALLGTCVVEPAGGEDFKGALEEVFRRYVNERVTGSEAPS